MGTAEVWEVLQRCRWKGWSWTRTVTLEVLVQDTNSNAVSAGLDADGITGSFGNSCNNWFWITANTNINIVSGLEMYQCCAISQGQCVGYGQFNQGSEVFYCNYCNTIFYNTVFQL